MPSNQGPLHKKVARYMLACKDVTKFQTHLTEVDTYSIAQVDHFLAFARMLAYKDVTELQTLH